MECTFIELELFTSARKENALILWDRKQISKFSNWKIVPIELAKKARKQVGLNSVYVFLAVHFSGHSVK